MVADTIAVLDAVGVERAVLVGVCSSAWEALLLRGTAPRPGARRRRHRALGAATLAPHRAQGGSHRRASTRSARRRGLGEAQPALLAARLAGLRGLLLRRDAAPSRTRPSRSRTWSGGRCESTAEAQIASADGAPLRRATTDEGEALLPDDHLPGARRARHRRPVQPLARGERVAELTGGAAGPARGVRPPPAGAATRCASTCCCASSSTRCPRRSRPAAALDPGHGPAAPGALPVVADRARPRAARPRDRAGAARAAAGRRGRLAHPGSR